MTTPTIEEMTPEQVLAAMQHWDVPGRYWYSDAGVDVSPADAKRALASALEQLGAAGEYIGRTAGGVQMTPLTTEGLTERRARFVYEGARLAAAAARAPIVPASWDDREEAFRKQFMEVIDRQCGEHRSKSPEELHGSWMQAYLLMGWKHGDTYSREGQIHPDLVPYANLGQLERDKDSVFMALCEIARQWIYAALPPAPEVKP